MDCPSDVLKYDTCCPAMFAQCILNNNSGIFLKKWQAVGKSASIDLGEHSKSNGSMIFTFHGAKQYYFLILTLQDCSLFCSVTSGLIRPVLSGTFSVLWPTKVTNTDQSDHFWKDCFTLSKRRNLWTIEDWHMSVLTVTCVLSKKQYSNKTSHIQRAVNISYSAIASEKTF